MFGIGPIELIILLVIAVALVTAIVASGSKKRRD
jgi:hypothetical protein